MSQRSVAASSPLMTHEGEHQREGLLEEFAAGILQHTSPEVLLPALAVPAGHGPQIGLAWLEPDVVVNLPGGQKHGFSKQPKEGLY